MSHNNLYDIRSVGRSNSEKERKKYVSFSVELDRSGGPIGITLATEDSSEVSDGKSPPIFISSMAEGGLAQTTKAIQIKDELVEVNGVNVKGKTLSEAIPLLQNAGKLVKLKLTRVVSIPERECRVPSFRLPPCSPRTAASPSPIYAPIQPSVSPIYAPLSSKSPPPPHQLHHHGFSNGMRSPTFSSSSQDKRSNNSSNTSSKTEDDDLLTTVTLLPQTGPKGNLIQKINICFAMNLFLGMEGSIPQEVNKVTLFKDPIFEDFGFSLSDGLYERGIFVAKIKEGGPADMSGLLKPFDRILQINQTRTTDFDCCLAVPLIAAAGDKIDLLV